METIKSLNEEQTSYNKKLVELCPEGYGMTSMVYLYPTLTIGTIDGKKVKLTSFTKGYNGLTFYVIIGDSKTSDLVSNEDILNGTYQVVSYIDGKFSYTDVKLDISLDCYGKIFNYFNSPIIQDLKKEVDRLSPIYKRLNPCMDNNNIKNYSRNESLDWTEAFNYLHDLLDGIDPTIKQTQIDSKRNYTQEQIEKEEKESK